MYHLSFPEEGVKTATVSEAGVVRRVAINRTIPVGGPHIHCEPPPLYGSSHRPQSDPGKLKFEFFFYNIFLLILYFMRELDIKLIIEINERVKHRFN